MASFFSFSEKKIYPPTGGLLKRPYYLFFSISGGIKKQKRLRFGKPTAFYTPIRKNKD
jgi:hypothetical protein